ncbi:hypothetical protein [Lysobacter gummosus]|uniref:hypothetical protein n=1 Tax=Lysobacter gummosus TaxID=262324 RepID=UPI0036429ACD
MDRRGHRRAAQRGLRPGQAGGGAVIPLPQRAPGGRRPEARTRPRPARFPRTPQAPGGFSACASTRNRNTN